MKYIAFFYPDLRSSQGWPETLSPLFEDLAANMPITFLCPSRANTEPSASTFEVARKEYLGSQNWPRFRDELLANVSLISLGMFHFGLLKVVLNIPTKSRIFILPLGQLDKFSLRRDVFSTDPSIRVQEARSAPLLQEGKNRRIEFTQLLRLVLNKKSMLMKELFLLAFGLIVAFRKISVTIIPLSANESDNVSARVRRLLGATTTRPVTLPFGLNQERLEVSERAVSPVGRVQADVLGEDNVERLSLVYFGRLEVEQKGLDLLLELMHHLRSGSALDVSLKLVGPGDRMSISKLSKLSASLDLKDTVELLLPGDYQPGSLEPLARADFSILLSRWDGWPRACQESLALGTPVICSEESNFGDVIREYRCGLVLPRGEAKRDKFERVLKFLEGANMFELGEKAKVAATACTGESAARDLLEVIGAERQPPARDF